MGLARERGLVELRTHDLRSWTRDKHHTTDDYPYGGGPGLVMKPEPIFEAVEAVQQLEDDPGYVVFLTPAGPSARHKTSSSSSPTRSAWYWSAAATRASTSACSSLADLELSIGDFVLTGGEIPAMVVIDAVARHVPGVLGDEESAQDESFADGLLEYPQYTRPAEYRGMEVPDGSDDPATMPRSRRGDERSRSPEPHASGPTCWHARR